MLHLGTWMLAHQATILFCLEVALSFHLGNYFSFVSVVYVGLGLQMIVVCKEES